MSGSRPAAPAWHSVHIRYEGRQEPLLTECIGPLVSSTRMLGLSRWFFLRYWKGGPHVRVRFRFEAGTPSSHWDALIPTIEEYLRLKPSEDVISAERLEESQRQLAALEGEPADAVVIYPNNTVVTMPYVPEYDKYGGPAGVALAESFFEASSDIVIAALSDMAGRSMSRPNVAFAMMLAGLRAAAYDERDTADFLGAYARFCERFVPADVWQSLRAKVQRPEVLQQFRGATAASEGRHPTWVQRWALTFASAVRALHEHAAAVRPAVTIAKKMDPLQFVLFNYLHTHNNRLGVTPAVEAQVAYLAQHIVAYHAGRESEGLRA